MYVTVNMDEVKLVCTSSDDCGVQEVKTQMDTLLDLRNQILRLLNTKLSENSIMVSIHNVQLGTSCILLYYHSFVIIFFLGCITSQITSWHLVMKGKMTGH